MSNLFFVVSGTLSGIGLAVILVGAFYCVHPCPAPYVCVDRNMIGSGVK